MCVLYIENYFVCRKSGFVMTEFQYGTFAYGRTICRIVK